MEEIEQTGGAYIGIARASYPFAKLKVNKYKLELNASILGNLVFRPSDVISIKPYDGFGIQGGISIEHRVRKYKTKVAFLTSGNIPDLINRIKQTGFLSNTEALPLDIEQYITIRQTGGSFPLKIGAVIAFIAIWNIFFFYDLRKLFVNGLNGIPLGIGAELALGFVVLSGILTLISDPFRQLILKPGRTFDDIKRFVYFLIPLAAFMLSMIFLMPHVIPKVH